MHSPLELGLAASAGLLAWRRGLVPRRSSSRAYAAIPGGTLDPTGIDTYVTRLVVPPAMPRTRRGAVEYEVPLAIQDRSFNVDGSLFYPGSRAFFDGFGGPYVPRSDVPPIWNPESFGNSMVVNGRTWPFLEVERRRTASGS